MKKFLPIFLAISILINVSGAAFFLYRRANYVEENNSVAKGFNNSLKTKQSVFESLPIDTNDIVFVGHSMTELFPLNEMFPGLKIKNRGVSGSTSQHLLERMEYIIKGHPKKLFIDIGVNDLIQNIPSNTLFLNYQKIVEQIQTKSPQTKIYVHSIFPVGEAWNKITPAIIDFNSTLKSYAGNKGLVYIDMYKSMNPLDSTLSIDGVHLTGKAYKIWADSLKTYLLL